MRQYVAEYLPHLERTKLGGTHISNPTFVTKTRWSASRESLRNSSSTDPTKHIKSMSHLLVYATTDSRLHADVLIVRLNRAGVPTQLISVIHPDAFRPNSTLCWIKGSVSFPLSSSAGRATVSGMLGLRLSAQERRWSRSPFIDGLCDIGLSHDQSLNVEESLLGNRIVIAVEVADESELPAIYHTLRGLEIEKVSTPDTAKPHVPALRSGRYRRVYRAEDLALPSFSVA